PAGGPPYGSGTPANGNPPYGSSPAGGPPYGSGTPANGNPPYGSSPAGGPPYGSGAPVSSAPYGVSGTPASGNAAVSSAPYGGAPAGGGAQVSSPPYGGGAPAGGGSVAYSRGSAAIPGTAAASGMAPQPGATPPMGLAATSVAGAAPIFGGAAPGVPNESRPWPPPPLAGAPKRNLGKILMVVALVVAVIAGGTTVGLILLNKGKKDNETAGGVTPTATTAAATTQPTVDPLAPPTDTMLIRVDTGNGDAQVSKVYSFKPGEDTRTELPGTKPGDVLPKWSHTRTQIALTHNNGDHTSIDIMNADGTGRHEVAEDAGGRVAWSADDKKIAFMKKFDGIKQIAVLNLETGELKQLTKTTTQKDDAMWSPDGKSILYWLNRNGVRQVYELTVANPKEPGRQITKPEVGQVNDPVYSPKGDLVLFTLEVDKENSDIWLVNIDGSNPHRVTSNPQREMDPTFSPDGNWFAFVRGAYDHPTIVVERVAGTGEQVLTKNGAREGHPCWF
ncbi:hypothetical protein AB0E90_07555, partial [Actinoplanes sp. NPDC026619]